MKEDDWLPWLVYGGAIAAGAWLLYGLLVATPLAMAERLKAVEEAQAFARSVGKPVLNVGCCGLGEAGVPVNDPRIRSAGDVNVDIRHQGEEWIDGRLHTFGDIYHLPFADKAFGSAIALHVLEHLEDPDAALAELNRVADRVWTIVPSPWDLGAWLYWDHKWVFLEGRAEGPKVRIR